MTSDRAVAGWSRFPTSTCHWFPAGAHRAICGAFNLKAEPARTGTPAGHACRRCVRILRGELEPQLSAARERRRTQAHHLAHRLAALVEVHVPADVRTDADVLETLAPRWERVAAALLIFECNGMPAAHAALIDETIRWATAWRAAVEAE
jgi:hypothetical protein